MRKCCENCEDYRDPAMCRVCEETEYQAKIDRDKDEEWQKSQQEVAWNIKRFRETY